MSNFIPKFILSHMHVKILIQKKLYRFLSYLEAKLCGSRVDIKPCERERYSDERVTKLRMRDKKRGAAGVVTCFKLGEEEGLCVV